MARAKRRSATSRGKTKKLAKAKPTRFRTRKTKTGTQRLGFKKSKVVEVTTFKKKKK